MVTRLSGGRGQIALKGHRIDDEWEALIKAAAGKNGQTFADFVVDVTRHAAQAIMKGEPALPAALPAPRLEDVAASLVARMADMAAEQRAATEQLRLEQAERMAALERQTRRARWRR